MSAEMQPQTTEDEDEMFSATTHYVALKWGDINGIIEYVTSLFRLLKRRVSLLFLRRTSPTASFALRVCWLITILAGFQRRLTLRSHTHCTHPVPLRVLRSESQRRRPVSIIYQRTSQRAMLCIGGSFRWQWSPPVPFPAR